MDIEKTHEPGTALLAQAAALQQQASEVAHSRTLLDARREALRARHHALERDTAEINAAAAPLVADIKRMHDQHATLTAELLRAHDQHAALGERARKTREALEPLLNEIRAHNESVALLAVRSTNLAAERSALQRQADDLHARLARKRPGDAHDPVNFSIHASDGQGRPPTPRTEVLERMSEHEIEALHRESRKP